MKDIKVIAKERYQKLRLYYKDIDFAYVTLSFEELMSITFSDKAEFLCEICNKNEKDYLQYNNKPHCVSCYLDERNRSGKGYKISNNSFMEDIGDSGLLIFHLKKKIFGDIITEDESVELVGIKGKNKIVIFKFALIYPQPPMDTIMRIAKIECESNGRAFALIHEADFVMQSQTFYKKSVWEHIEIEDFDFEAIYNNFLGE